MDTRKLEDFANKHDGILEINYRGGIGWFINIYVMGDRARTFVGDGSKYQRDALAQAEDHVSKFL